MFGLKLSVRGHQHVFQLEIPELQAFHGRIELGPKIIIMAHIYNSVYSMLSLFSERSKIFKHLLLNVILNDTLSFYILTG